MTPTTSAIAPAAQRDELRVVGILIVDDEEPVRRAMRRVLERQHAVDEAPSVEDAQRKLAAAQFELVLCDITMPGTSGLQLAELVAGDTPDTVVVMVTGVDDPDIAAQALRMGVYGYLVKPFTANEIMITVAVALRRRALELERRTVEEHERELHLLADRERIGRDLHDNVIQRLFATGLALHSAGQLITDDRAHERVAGVVDELDAIIRTIRTVIFDVESGERPSLRGSVLDLARESAQTLGFEPTVVFNGAVDTMVAGNAADQLLATLRESLSNIVRHASAKRVDIEISVDRGVALTVRDDGVGIGRTGGDGTGGRGVANMRARAERLGGRFTIEQPTTGGTQLEWRIPLDER